MVVAGRNLIARKVRKLILNFVRKNASKARQATANRKADVIKGNKKRDDSDNKIGENKRTSKGRRAIPKLKNTNVESSSSLKRVSNRNRNTVKTTNNTVSSNRNLNVLAVGDEFIENNDQIELNQSQLLTLLMGPTTRILDFVQDSRSLSKDLLDNVSYNLQQENINLYTSTREFVVNDFKYKDRMVYDILADKIQNEYVSSYGTSDNIENSREAIEQDAINLILVWVIYYTGLTNYLGANTDINITDKLNTVSSQQEFSRQDGQNKTTVFSENINKILTNTAQFSFDGLKYLYTGLENQILNLFPFESVLNISGFLDAENKLDKNNTSFRQQVIDETKSELDHLGLTYNEAEIEEEVDNVVSQINRLNGLNYETQANKIFQDKYNLAKEPRFNFDNRRVEFTADPSQKTSLTFKTYANTYFSNIIQKSTLTLEDDTTFATIKLKGNSSDTFPQSIQDYTSNGISTTNNFILVKDADGNVEIKQLANFDLQKIDDSEKDSYPQVAVSPIFPQNILFETDENFTPFMVEYGIKTKAPVSIGQGWVDTPSSYIFEKESFEVVYSVLPDDFTAVKKNLIANIENNGFTQINLTVPDDLLTPNFGTNYDLNFVISSNVGYKIYLLDDGVDFSDIDLLQLPSQYGTLLDEFYYTVQGNTIDRVVFLGDYFESGTVSSKENKIRRKQMLNTGGRKNVMVPDNRELVGSATNKNFVITVFPINSVVSNQETQKTNEIGTRDPFYNEVQMNQAFIEMGKAITTNNDIGRSVSQLNLLSGVIEYDDLNIYYLDEFYYEFDYYGTPTIDNYYVALKTNDSINTALATLIQVKEDGVWVTKRTSTTWVRSDVDKFYRNYQYLNGYTGPIRFGYYAASFPNDEINFNNFSMEFYCPFKEYEAYVTTNYDPQLLGQLCTLDGTITNAYYVNNLYNRFPSEGSDSYIIKDKCVIYYDDLTENYQFMSATKDCFLVQDTNESYPGQNVFYGTLNNTDLDVNLDVNFVLANNFVPNYYNFIKMNGFDNILNQFICHNINNSDERVSYLSSFATLGYKLTDSDYGSRIIKVFYKDDEGNTKRVIVPRPARNNFEEFAFDDRNELPLPFFEISSEDDQCRLTFPIKYYDDENTNTTIATQPPFQPPDQEVIAGTLVPRYNGASQDTLYFIEGDLLEDGTPKSTVYFTIGSEGVMTFVEPNTRVPYALTYDELVDTLSYYTYDLDIDYYNYTSGEFESYPLGANEVLVMKETFTNGAAYENPDRTVKLGVYNKTTYNFSEINQYYPNTEPVVSGNIFSQLPTRWRVNSVTTKNNANVGYSAVMMRNAFKNTFDQKIEYKYPVEFYMEVDSSMPLNRPGNVTYIDFIQPYDNTSNTQVLTDNRNTYTTPFAVNDVVTTIEPNVAYTTLQPICYPSLNVDFEPEIVYKTDNNNILINLANDTSKNFTVQVKKLSDETLRIYRVNGFNSTVDNSNKGDLTAVAQNQNIDVNITEDSEVLIFNEEDEAPIQKFFVTIEGENSIWTELFLYITDLLIKDFGQDIDGSLSITSLSKILKQLGASDKTAYTNTLNLLSSFYVENADSVTDSQAAIKQLTNSLDGTSNGENGQNLVSLYLGYYEQYIFGFISNSNNPLVARYLTYFLRSLFTYYLNSNYSTSSTFKMSANNDNGASDTYTFDSSNPGTDASLKFLCQVTYYARNSALFNTNLEFLESNCGIVNPANYQVKLDDTNNGNMKTVLFAGFNGTLSSGEQILSLSPPSGDTLQYLFDATAGVQDIPGVTAQTTKQFYDEGVLILPVIRNLLTEDVVLLTGHGNEAGVLTYVAFELAREFTTKTFKLYLIGCPKQGDSNYETLINGLSNLEINLINNENDTMIQAPPSDIAIYSDFRQIGSVLKSITFGNAVDLLNFNAILSFLTKNQQFADIVNNNSILNYRDQF